MRFGLFGGATVPRGEQPEASARRLAEYIEAHAEAEALGFWGTFLTEHHFTGAGQISAPFQVLGAIAMRTTRLRLGTAVMVLAWHNPAMLAEQAATLDVVSGGRLELGVGRGYRASEFSGFAMPMEEADGRFDEGFAVLKQAFTSNERFSHHGTYWRLDNVLVEPQPVQRPHPPLWMAAGTPRSIRKAAELGCNLLLDQFQSPAQIEERIALYRSAVEAQGRPFDPLTVAVARNVYVAEGAADREAARARQIAVHRRMVALSQRAGASSGSHILQYDRSPGSTEENLLYGPAEEIVARLGELRAAGVAQVLVNGGGAKPIEGLRRFARQVMPAMAEP
jgi:alkanesulfonate monooxygenase SsuD/methylene tetrahydromethanopterin reductase-like flavin-dependent oxidoreductase (luciferase family)